MFYRGPCFDAVEIVRAGRHNTLERAYAQLLLLFEVKVSHAKGEDPKPTPYALIRWYKQAPVPHDKLETAGCIRFKFDTQGSKREVLDVVHLSSIVCRHCVVPSFDDEQAFYLSCFSPTRPV